MVRDPCPGSARVEYLKGRLPLAETDCLFCRIVAGEIPADVVLSTPDLVAFRDISPKAPTHILIIPRSHVASVSDLEPAQTEVMGKLFLAARDLADDADHFPGTHPSRESRYWSRLGRIGIWPNEKGSPRRDTGWW